MARRSIASYNKERILLITICAAIVLLYVFVPSQVSHGNEAKGLPSKHEPAKNTAVPALLFASEDIALSDHPAATQDEQEACLFIAFTNGDNPILPTTWHSVAEPGINHVVVNVNQNISNTPDGREMIVQANFENGKFRPLLDFSLTPKVEFFNRSTWQHRPSIMPLKRPIMYSMVVDSFNESDASRIPQVECSRDCFSDLLTSTFCLLPPSQSFQSRLLATLRAGCIPVVLSATQPLPFQDQLEWTQASFRIPLSMTALVPEMLNDLDKEVLLEMRRLGKVFLARIDDAQALSKSLIAALSERIHVGLALHPEVTGNLIAPNGAFKNSTYTRIPSEIGSHKHTASIFYSRARWNSGRDLAYTPRLLHDVPKLPGDAPFAQGTKESLVSVSNNGLGFARDNEQFTVVVLAYNRDDGVRRIIGKLSDCPFLNKILVVWNNHDRRPNGTWPEIHVPVEFILSERNSLTSRFVPYDRIETEAVVSMDDDVEVGQPELTFAFRMWRENRDRIVGFPERFHSMKDGRGIYGFSKTGACEYSMIITGFAFMHKEFLFEFTYNQHPSILEHIENNRNCEDIAMNFLVSHLTRKAPLKVVKKLKLTNEDFAGISYGKGHKNKRDECIRMLSAIYGYNPLLFTQEVARPGENCVNGFSLELIPDGHDSENLEII